MTSSREYDCTGTLNVVLPIENLKSVLLHLEYILDERRASAPVEPRDHVVHGTKVTDDRQLRHSLQHVTTRQVAPQERQSHRSLQRSQCERVATTMPGSRSTQTSGFHHGCHTSSLQRE